MHTSDNSAGYLDYRVLERDRIELREIGAVPDPARLRLACLMIYAGLLLSLSAMLISGSAMAAADDCRVAGGRTADPAGVRTGTVEESRLGGIAWAAGQTGRRVPGSHRGAVVTKDVRCCPFSVAGGAAAHAGRSHGLPVQFSSSPRLEPSSINCC